QNRSNAPDDCSRFQHAERRGHLADKEEEKPDQSHTGRAREDRGRHKMQRQAELDLRPASPASSAAPTIIVVFLLIAPAAARAVLVLFLVAGPAARAVFLKTLIARAATAWFIVVVVASSAAAGFVLVIVTAPAATWGRLVFHRLDDV